MGADSNKFELKSDKNGAIYINIQGLFSKSKKNKVCHLRDLAIESNSPFIILTETWLTEDILDAEITIPKYVLYRSDRANGRSHGGSCVYVRSDLTSKLIMSHSNGTCDSLAVKVKIFESIVICMYRPPDTKLEQFEDALNVVQDAIDENMKTDSKCKTILQVGDYNFPFLSWPSRKIYENQIQEEKKSDEKKQAELFLEYCDKNFLTQYCLTPTRGRNILDLILSNNSSIISTYTTIVNSKFSDHFLLKIWLNISYNQSSNEGKREYPYTTILQQFDLENANDKDWLRFNSLLETVDFEEETKFMNTKQKLRKFYEVLEGTALEVFKKKKEYDENKSKEESTKPKNKIPKRVRQLMKRKSKLSKLILASKQWWKTYEIVEEIEEIEKELDDEYTKNNVKVENEAIKRLKKDPKYFYSYAKKKSKSPNLIGPFLEKDGKVVQDSFEKAEKLRQQYESVFSKPIEERQILDADQFFGISGHRNDQDDHHEPEVEQKVEQEEEQEEQECCHCKQEKVHLCQRDQVGRYQAHPGDEVNISTPVDQEQPRRQELAKSPEIENTFFDYHDVVLAIEDIPSGASPGPDGVPPRILKGAKTTIARMLVVIFKTSIDDGDIPEVLKMAFVTPVHKGGSRSQPVQYRPISLTSHVIKVLERVLRKSLVGFLDLNGKMDPNQHGSRSQRSCLSQLLEHHEEILRILESGENVDAIYLDFLKAFDKVDIGILLKKTKSLGITGKLGRWIHSFLTGRQQIILVNGKKSQVSYVISGIPQGTVLAPILFLIYISDIGKEVKANIKIYVDDTKVKKAIKDENSVEELQNDLEVMYKWASENNMAFNGSKFQLIRYGKNEQIKEDTLYFTDKMDEVIQSFESLKDLGVMMNHDADFKTNVAHVIKKSRKKIGWILRSFHCRNIYFMKHMYKTLVTPHVDYSSQLWMPIDCTEIEKIEKVQRDFFRNIPQLWGLNYWEQISKMKMLSLQRRLERYRIIYSWKILENLAPNCGLQKILESENSRQGRRLKIPDVGKNAPTKRRLEQVFQFHGPKLFNCLPAKIRNMTNVGLEEFKMALDLFLENVPDQPKIDGLTPGTQDPAGVYSNSVLHQNKRGAMGA